MSNIIDHRSFPSYIVLDEHSQAICSSAFISSEKNTELLSVVEMARRWGFELLSESQRDTAPVGSLLAVYRGQWHLQVVGNEADITVDFSRPELISRLGRNNVLSEQVVRAVRGRLPAVAPLSVLDATAGFAVDSMLLAASGCEVVLLEKIPFLADLLAQAIVRAGNANETPDLAVAAQRLQLCCGDSVMLMRDWSAPRPDVIYLDPMYHVDHGDSDTGLGLKKSAAIKKQMALLQWLTRGDDNLAENNNALIHSALALARTKVVVKRAPRAPNLGKIKPSSSLLGKAARFDIYAC